MIKWNKNGLAAREQGNVNSKRYLLSREAEVKAAAHRNVGNNRGLRQHAGLVSAEQQSALCDGDDSKLLAALRHNGAHPDFVNGR
jgi:hypothetical protein